MTQEELEKHQTEMFFKAVGIGIKSNEEGPNPPDRLVRLQDGKTVALEITEYHPVAASPESLSPMRISARWHKSLWPKLDSERRAHAGLSGVDLQLVFRDPQLPARNHHDAIAEELIGLLVNHMPDLETRSGTTGICFYPQDDIAAHPEFYDGPGELALPAEQWPSLRDAISIIRADIWPLLTWPHWSCPQTDSAFVSPCRATLRRLFESKLAIDCSVPQAETWLLIVCEVRHDISSHVYPLHSAERSEWMTIIDGFRPRLDQSQFQQVWLLSQGSRAALCIYP